MYTPSADPTYQYHPEQNVESERFAIVMGVAIFLLSIIRDEARF